MKFLFWLNLFLVALVLSAFCTGVSASTVEDTDDVNIEDDTTVTDVENDDSQKAVEQGPSDDDSATAAKPSDLQTLVYFVNPKIRTNPMEFVADSDVELLVGVYNDGNEAYAIDMLEASFRYPLDYSYVIQNLSRNALLSVVEAKANHTFAYHFKPLDGFIGRPLGLVINLHYTDSLDSPFIKTVFNETIKVIENSEKFDAEIWSLYVMFIMLLGLGAYYVYKRFWAEKLKKAREAAAATKNLKATNGIDYDWLPKETLRFLNKNGKKNNSRSPRSQRSPKSPQQGNKKVL